jgi:hypothetical protein
MPFDHINFKLLKPIFDRSRYDESLYISSPPPCLSLFAWEYDRHFMCSMCKKVTKKENRNFNFVEINDKGGIVQSDQWNLQSYMDSYVHILEVSSTNPKEVS